MMVQKGTLWPSGSQETLLWCGIVVLLLSMLVLPVDAPPTEEQGSEPATCGSNDHLDIPTNDASPQRIEVCFNGFCNNTNRTALSSFDEIQNNTIRIDMKIDSLLNLTSQERDIRSTTFFVWFAGIKEPTQHHVDCSEPPSAPGPTTDPTAKAEPVPVETIAGVLGVLLLLLLLVVVVVVVLCLVFWKRIRDCFRNCCLKAEPPEAAVEQNGVAGQGEPQLPYPIQDVEDNQILFNESVTTSNSEPEVQPSKEETVVDMSDRSLRCSECSFGKRAASRNWDATASDVQQPNGPEPRIFADNPVQDIPNEPQ